MVRRVWESMTPGRRIRALRAVRSDRRAGRVGHGGGSQGPDWYLGAGVDPETVYDRRLGEAISALSDEVAARGRTERKDDDGSGTAPPIRDEPTRPADPPHSMSGSPGSSFGRPSSTGSGIGSGSSGDHDRGSSGSW
jgi:hypothetical protein